MSGPTAACWRSGDGGLMRIYMLDEVRESLEDSGVITR